MPRPLEAPRPVRLQAIRLEGWTTTVLFGSVDLHGPSTSRLDAEATWEEWIDDPVQPAPERRRSAATAFTADIGPNEDMVILFGTDQTLPNPGQPEPIRAARLNAPPRRHEAPPDRVPLPGDGAIQ
ncbi:MAG: hypothetical protein WKF58_15025 [Ilumatobacteraceae bacterium]